MPGLKGMALSLRKGGGLYPLVGYKAETLTPHRPVIAESDRGLEYCLLASLEQTCPKRLARDLKIKRIIRYATAEDERQKKRIEEKELLLREAFARKAAEHELPIDLVQVECLFDEKRLVFFYKLREGAEKARVNTRELTRDLAETYKARIEVHPVGARDAARLRRGMGPCGCSLCCATFLLRPIGVTVKAVKEQGLALGALRTAGMCGKLLCCLTYETGMKGSYTPAEPADD